MRIYTKRDDEQSGPHTVAKVIAKLHDGSLSLSDLAWHEKAEGWKEISKCGFITREMPPELPSTAVVAPLTPVSPTPAAIQIASYEASEMPPKRAFQFSRIVVFGGLLILILGIGPRTLGTGLTVFLAGAIAYFWWRGHTVKPKGSMILGPDLFETEVVGESNYQPALEVICGGRKARSAEFYCEAALVLENSNPHDNKAVRIDINGKTVGYLSRRLAREYRQRLVEAGHPNLSGICKAVIRGGRDKGNGELTYFGVWLDLPNDE